MPQSMNLSPGDLSDLIAYYVANEQYLGPEDGVSEGFLAEMLGQQAGMNRFDIRGLAYSAIDRGRALTDRWHREFREPASSSTPRSPEGESGAGPRSSAWTPPDSPSSSTAGSDSASHSPTSQEHQASLIELLALARTAIEDAIRRPMGVEPASAAMFFRLAKEATV